MVNTMVLFVVSMLVLGVPSLSMSSSNPCQELVSLHGGGTDKCGCHYNRKTGKYHCHNRKMRGGDCPD